MVCPQHQFEVKQVFTVKAQKLTFLSSGAFELKTIPLQVVIKNVAIFLKRS